MMTIYMKQLKKWSRIPKKIKKRRVLESPQSKWYFHTIKQRYLHRWSDSSIRKLLDKQAPTIKQEPTEKDIRDEIRKNPQEENSIHAEYDQEISISFDDDEDSTVSQKDDLEDYIEYLRRNTEEADGKYQDTTS